MQSPEGALCRRLSAKSGLDTGSVARRSLSLSWRVRIYLIVELLLLVRVLDELKVCLVFKFGLRRGVLRDEPGRRLYGPVKDGLRRLPGPVATIAAARGSLPRLLHSPSSFATVPGTLTILSNHGNNTPRNTTERSMGVEGGKVRLDRVRYRGTSWEASKVLVILGRTPRFACTGERDAC